MNTVRAIQNPVVQTFIRRISTTDSRSVANNVNVSCKCSKVGNFEKTITVRANQRYVS